MPKIVPRRGCVIHRGVAIVALHFACGGSVYQKETNDSPLQGHRRNLSRLGAESARGRMAASPHARGKNEKARGALCWTLYYEGRQHLLCCGGWERATDIVKASRRDRATVEMNSYGDYDVLALETVKPKGSGKRK